MVGHYHKGGVPICFCNERRTVPFGWCYNEIRFFILKMYFPQIQCRLHSFQTGEDNMISIPIINCWGSDFISFTWGKLSLDVSKLFLIFIAYGHELINNFWVTKML